MSIDSTNFFSYVYSSWLTKYLWKAYRKGITLSDIPEISPLDSCSSNIQKFEKLWNEELRLRGPSSASLPLVAWRFVRFRVLISCTLNACSQIINFIIQTVFLHKLLEFSENPDRHFFSGMHWVIYIVAFDLLQMTLYTWSGIMNQRTALRLKSACLSLLFKKMVNWNSMKGSTDEFVTLMTENGHKIYDAVNLGTSIINVPVVTICAIICVATWLSPVSLVGVVIFLLFYLIQYWLVHLINYCKESAHEYTDARMQKTTKALNSIRLIKINGWEQHFIQNILNIRNRESKWLWKLSYVNSLNSSMAHAVPIIAIIIMFFLHFTVNHTLTASLAFPICVFITVQMHGTFMIMKSSLSHLKDSIETFQKIKCTLLIEDTGCHAMKPYEASQAVAIVNGTFIDDSMRSRNSNESVENTKQNHSIDNIVNETEKHLLDSAPDFELRRFEILSNITFKARKGQLIGICGPVNSGKSSLLLAALGQIKMSTGQLMRQGSCAFVSQRAWITDGTIRENILFEEPYDAKRYYEAQVVCKLRQDIKRLPNGDETEIGEGGLKISEALKQRIALARAFYADRDIYFLDDPLSSMDEKIGQEIFEDLILRALAEKTILFVTHELEFLHRCDYMYIMREGKIIEHGRHKELMRLGREYATMVRVAMNDEGDYINELHDTYKNGSDQAEDELIFENKKIFARNVSTIDFESKELDSYRITDNDPSPKQIKPTTYYNYAKALGGFVLLAPVIIVYVIYGGVGVLSLLRLTWWIEAMNELDKEKNFGFYKNWYGFCFFLIILGCIVQSFVVQFATTKIADNLHNALLNKLMYAPIKFFDTTSARRIKNLFFHNLEHVSLSLPSRLDDTFRYVVIGFFTFFVLITTIPWFTNYFVFSSVLFFFVGKIYRTAQLNFRTLENSLKTATNSFLQNTIQGLSTIRTFKKENDLLSKFQDLLDDNNACCFIKGVSERWLSIRLQLLTTTCIFVATSSIVTLTGEISPAIAGLTFVYLLQVPNIIQMCMRHYAKMERSFAHVQSISDYLQELVSENDTTSATVSPNSDWPMTGLIQFDNVQLRYSDHEQLALDHVSFTINNAEKIGILVKPQSSISAFIAAMYRLYELNGGTISVDCVDISKIDIKLLRNQLSIIPKDPIFYGSIRFFLDPTKCHSDSEIWNVLEKVHLKDKVSTVASQLHYSIDGKIFNVNEKQLLFLARAYLRQNKILLLEEITNASAESSALIHEVIEKEFSSSTVLIIARRLRTVLSCDRVLVMETGRLLEFDSPSTLLAQQGSHLMKMYTEEQENDDRL